MIIQSKDDKDNQRETMILTTVPVSISLLLYFTTVVTMFAGCSSPVTTARVESILKNVILKSTINTSIETSPKTNYDTCFNHIQLLTGDDMLI